MAQKTYRLGGRQGLRGKKRFRLRSLGMATTPLTKEALKHLANAGEWNTKVQHAQTAVTGEIRSRRPGTRGYDWIVVWDDGTGHVFPEDEAIKNLLLVTKR